jgi:hypothetical protein
MKIQVLIILLSAGTFADWPMFQNSPAFTGYAADETLNMSTMERVFEYPIGKRITAGPVIRNDTLYIGAHDSTFYAIDISGHSASIIWSYKTNGKIYSTAALGNNIVLMGSMDGSLVAFKTGTSTADTVWTFDADGPVYAPVTYTPDKDAYFVGTLAGYLISLDASGSQRWQFIDTACMANPEVQYGTPYANGHLALGYKNGYLYYLQDNPTSYTVKWKENPGGVNSLPYTTAPTIAGDNIMVSNSMSERRYSFGYFKTGTGTYKGLESGLVLASFCADTSSFYYNVDSRWVAQFARTLPPPDSTTVTTLWNKNNGNRIMNGALTDDHWVMLNEEGKIIIMDKGSGSVVYSDNFADSTVYKEGFRGTRSAPAIYNGRIYFGADNGNLYCYGYGAGSTREDSRDAEGVKPGDFALDAVPNPFNPVTTVSYHVPEKGHVNISLFNVGGRKTATLVDKIQNAGSYSFLLGSKSMNGNPKASGLYYLVYKGRGKVITESLILLK